MQLVTHVMFICFRETEAPVGVEGNIISALLACSVYHVVITTLTPPCGHVMD